MLPVTATQAIPDYEETIDIDAELTNAKKDSNDKEAFKKAGSHAKTSGPNAALSIPSDLATTQGQMAYDVRYFYTFLISPTTCYRCK